MKWLGALVLLLVVGPLVELWVIIGVADVIGGWQTILILVGESIIGGWLMKRQGRSIVGRIDQRLRAHDLPTRDLVDGLLILLAGALMLTPGFITDIVGFVLLIPPSRALVRAALMRRFQARLGQGFSFVGMGGAAGGPPRTRFGRGGGYVDTTGRVDSTRVPEAGDRRVGPGDAQ